jgi:hypothetical protein
VTPLPTGTRPKTAARIPALALGILLLLPAMPASATDSPLAGEALLARDVDLREGPSLEAPVVRSLAKGTTVSSLGSPRGTGFMQVGIGGRPVGYVPAGSLASIYAPREVSGTVAVVARDRVAPGGQLDGSHVLRRSTTGTEIRDGKRREAKLEPGTVLGLLDMRDGKARLASETIASVTLDPDALLPIVGVHDLGSGQSAAGQGQALGLYVARVGDYPAPAEAEAAWDVLLRQAPHLGEHRRFVYPVLGRTLRFALAFGPFDKAGADAACLSLAQRQADCWIVEVAAY